MVPADKLNETFFGFWTIVLVAEAALVFATESEETAIISGAEWVNAVFSVCCAEAEKLTVAKKAKKVSFRFISNGFCKAASKLQNSAVLSFNGKFSGKV